MKKLLLIGMLVSRVALSAEPKLLAVYLHHPMHFETNSVTFELDAEPSVQHVRVSLLGTEGQKPPFVDLVDRVLSRQGDAAFELVAELARPLPEDAIITLTAVPLAADGTEGEAVRKVYSNAEAPPVPGPSCTVHHPGETSLKVRVTVAGEGPAALASVTVISKAALARAGGNVWGASERIGLLKNAKGHPTLAEPGVIVFDVPLTLEPPADVMVIADVTVTDPFGRSILVRNSIATPCAERRDPLSPDLPRLRNATNKVR